MKAGWPGFGEAEAGDGIEQRRDIRQLPDDQGDGAGFA
jgi:hypothetical protein